MGGETPGMARGWIGVDLPVEDVDGDVHSVGGLWEFVATNVVGTGPLTEEAFDRAVESGYPGAFSSHFELPLPEGMPR